MELRSFARGGLLGLITLVVEKSAALVLVVGLARTLSPADYGRYSFLIAYLTLFQVLADFGTETILLRRLAAEPRARGRVLAGALGLRLTLAILAGSGAVLLAPWGEPGDPALASRTALAATALLFASQPGYRALLRSELRMGTLLGVAALTSALMLLLVVLAVTGGYGIDGVFVAIALANVTGFVVAAVLARSEFRFRLAVDVPLWRELLRESWPIGANIFVVTVGMRVGPLLIMRLRGPVEVGYFASASRLTDALNLLGDAAMLSVYPLFVRYATARPDALRALAELTAKLLGVVLLGVILVVSQTASDVMGTLFRPEFAVAGPVLAILSWSALLAALGNVYAHLLVAVGRQQVLFRVNCVTATLQVVLQLLLLRALGLRGAALAVVVTSLISHTTLFLLPETRTWVRPCVRAVGAVTLVAVAVLALGSLLPFGPYARAAVALLLFAIGLLASGMAGPADVRRLQTLLHSDAEAPAVTSVPG
jgi:O-antigen/teichoic acid export membrane protein